MSESASVPLVVAIDGPVGAGKSAVARRLAERLGWRHLDTGAMYRAVTLLVLEAGAAADDADFAARAARSLHLEMGADGRILLGDGRDVTHAIRDERVSRNVAAVADNLDVRRALATEQRRIGLERPCVAEGRDMATVVFPDAPFKFFLDASAESRAARRVRQLEAHGGRADIGQVRRDLDERDRRDRARSWGALQAAPDARIIDTTNLTLERVVELLATTVLSEGRARGFLPG